MQPLTSWISHSSPIRVRDSSRKRGVHKGLFHHRSLTEPTSSDGWLVKGALSGLAAGIVMATYIMLASAIAGDGLWAFPRTVAALFVGEPVAGSGFDAGSVVSGLLIHLTLATLFGVHCAVMIGFFTTWLPLVALVADGVLFGLVLWGFNALIVAPVLPGRILVDDLLFLGPLPSWAWATGNLLYGALLGLIYGRWRGGETTITSG